MISYIFLHSSSNLKYNNITPSLPLSSHAFFLLFFLPHSYLSASPSSFIILFFSFPQILWLELIEYHYLVMVIINHWLSYSTLYHTLCQSIFACGHHFSSFTLLSSCDEAKRRNTCLHGCIWSFWSSNLDKTLDEFTAITNILLSSYLHIRQS